MQFISFIRFLFVTTLLCQGEAALLSPKTINKLTKTAAAATILSTASLLTGPLCYAADFNSPDGSFSFRYPDSFKISEKMLGLTVKTHDYEVFLKSEIVKGFNAGLSSYSYVM